MSNRIRLYWPLPTQRERGAPLPAEEISHVEVSWRVQNSPEWTVLQQVAPPATELIISDVTWGNYEAQFVVVDTDGKASDPSVIPVSLADDSPPQAISGAGYEVLP